MTISLLLAVIVPVLATARITRLITDDKLTAPLRGELLHRLTYDRKQRTVIRNHKRALDDARAAGHKPPNQQPMLPPAKHPFLARTKLWFSYLLSCRWCAAVWVSIPVCLLCREAINTPALTEHPTTTGLWILGTSYAVGWLSEQE